MATYRFTSRWVLPLILIVLFLAGSPGFLHAVEQKGITGSTSCRSCHEKFYQLWSTSHHGLAMQPYTAKLATSKLTPQKDAVVIGGFRYRADIEGEKGWVREQGPGGEKKYPIVHAMGGKNVYYFLTPMERGRLQTLPVAYDVQRKEWFDTALSGVRHFPGEADDTPVNWKEWPYTFNTAYESPNACNICHSDEGAAWADKWVREWHEGDYQKPVLHRAELIQAARDRDWKRFPEMLDYLQGPERDEVFTTSLVRLLAACEDVSKWPVVRTAAKDPSPLVRAAAVTSMVNYLTPENVAVLLTATRDDSRLVRMRAADTLAALPPEMIDKKDRQALDNATAELEASFRARPDDAMGYYNLGNLYMDRGDLQKAVELFETAIKMRSDSILPLVNVSLAYARLGNPVKAEARLKQALEIDPGSAEAHYNMGLLKAEQNDFAVAERHLRAALKTDPNFPETAYNLCILVSKNNLDEAVGLCRKAHDLRPRDAKYAYTLAFYLGQKGKRDEAIAILQKLVQQQPNFTDASMLLRALNEQQKTP